MSLSRLSCHGPTHAASSVALARSFRIESTTAATAQTWRFTTAPCDHELLEEDGVWHSYSPAQAVVRSTTRRLAQLGERSSELRIGTTDASFDGSDVALRFLDGALVYEFLVDWQNWHRPPMQCLRWRVSNWTPGRDSVLLELVGIATDLQREVEDAFGPACRNVFAGTRCDAAGIIAADTAFGFRDFEVGAGTHTRTQFVVRERVVPHTFPSAALAAADWWSHGAAKFTTGDNDDVQTIVESNTTPAVVGSVYATTVRVVKPLPHIPAEGDRISLRVGCNRSRAHCGTKFGNLDQFRGFDYQPGNDFLKRSPEAS